MRSILLYSEIDLRLVLEISQDHDYWNFTTASTDDIVHIIDVFFEAGSIIFAGWK